MKSVDTFRTPDRELQRRPSLRTVEQTLNLKSAINIRYAEMAPSCCSLSCGGALDHANVQKNETFVDLGSGRGNDVMKAARKAGPEGFAYGIDFTEEMIQVAETNRNKLGLNNVKFINAAIDSIPLDDGIADVVISNCTINHAKNKSAVYAEIYRILKTGGRFIVSDVIAEKELPDDVKNDPEAWAKCYGGSIVKEEYFTAIHKAGFSDIEVLELSDPYEKGGVMVQSITIRGVKS